MNGSYFYFNILTLIFFFFLWKYEPFGIVHRHSVSCQYATQHIRYILTTLYYLYVCVCHMVRDTVNGSSITSLMPLRSQNYYILRHVILSLIVFTFLFHLLFRCHSNTDFTGCAKIIITYEPSGCLCLRQRHG